MIPMRRRFITTVPPVAGTALSRSALLLVCAALLMMLSGCALFRDYSRIESVAVAQPENFIAKGDSAYERGAYAEAALSYRESARRGEQTAVAWFNFANAMVRLDRVPDAMEAYRRAVAAAPGFLKAHQNLAALYQIQGDISGAARHYQAAARIDSADANSRFRLGELAQKAGDLAEAVSWYERAIAADGQDEAAHSGMTQVYLLTGDTAKALALLERYNANAKSPRSWALILQGDLRVRKGLVDPALQSYQEAAAADTADIRPFLRMAKALRGSESIPGGRGRHRTGVANTARPRRTLGRRRKPALRIRRPDGRPAGLRAGLQAGQFRWPGRLGDAGGMARKAGRTRSRRGHPQCPETSLSRHAARLESTA